jgi:hypothetical protein
MTAAVNGQSPLPRAGVAEVALDVGLEALDVGALEDSFGCVLERGISNSHGSVKIPLQAPRVRRQRIPRRVGAEVDGVVLERTRRHASTARATTEEPACSVHFGTIRSHRRLRPVEKGRFLYAACVQTPLPVWECPFVSAHIAELLLVRPDVEAVEEQEVCLDFVSAAS